MKAIDVKSLSKKYGDFKALDGVDLSVSEGEVFALLGPNGAGKTTLMRILTTQIPPTSGLASVMGMDVARDGAQVRRLVSYVPQEMSVWMDISGYENMLIYAKIYGLPSKNMKKSIMDSLEFMGLGDAADHLVSTYSGGMMRKLEIASAVMSKPRVLFLDEPTIGLDPASRKAVWEKITSLSSESGTTVFFSTHYMDEANSYAGRICIISNGRIVRFGTPEDLKRGIGGTKLSLEVSKQPTQKDMKAIRSMDSVHSARLAGGSLEIVLMAEGEKLDSMLACLSSMGLGISRMSSSQPTLDDVFLKYADSHDSRAAGVSGIKNTRDRIRKS
ncbi:MAG: ATP-binding cassette domain-containing protein [Candidatus Micrarchaeia archaeon]